MSTILTSEMDGMERIYIEIPTVTAGPASKIHNIVLEHSLTFLTESTTVPVYEKILAETNVAIAHKVNSPILISYSSPPRRHLAP